MSTDASESGDLGSLAQSARVKQLRTARGILFFVGILMVAINAFVMFNAESIVDSQFKKEMDRLRGQGMVFDQGKVQELKKTAVQTVKLFAGVTVALGGVFIVFGFMIYQYPVPITITSLVLFIGKEAVFGMIDPMTLVQGWLIKIVIVVCLISAIKAAIAYEKERQDQEMQPSFGGGEDQSQTPQTEF